LANSLVQYTRIRESERLANPVLQIAKPYYNLYNYQLLSPFLSSFKAFLCMAKGEDL